MPNRLIEQSLSGKPQPGNGSDRGPARQDFIDWRTRDPHEIQGENIPVEELRTYCEQIEELLVHGEGRYVLIVGREVIGYFDDLTAAFDASQASHAGRPILIKKVVAFEPIHTLGGAAY